MREISKINVFVGEYLVMEPSHPARLTGHQEADIGPVKNLRWAENPS
jgi:hypothetical protein